ncbi:unnamed protein product [Trichobilharzia szidati]|nr:unnamed protein product [Trichobilharzia szidati]
MIVQSVSLWGRRLYKLVESAVMWLFRTEICLFLSVSGILSAFCVLESFLHPDDGSETLEIVTLTNDTDADSKLNNSFPTSVENISTFISLVLGLFAVLLVLWKLAIIVFFGSLTPSEKVSISKSLFRFVLLHFIILSGAINPSKLMSLLGWLSWFSVLGVLHMLTCVASSRCNQISASGSVNTRQWVRIYSMLLVVSTLNWYLLKAGLENCFILADIDVETNGDFMDVYSRSSFLTGLKTPTVLGALKAKITGKKELLYDAVDVVALLISEFVLLMCTIFHLFFGLLIQAYDRWCLYKGQSWRYQSTVTYYYELIFTCIYRLIEIAHFLHLLLWSRVFSIASLVVFLHIRVSYSNLANSISRHLAQRRLMKYINENYQACRTNRSMSKDTDTHIKTDSKDSHVFSHDSENDSALVCAICWEIMTNWRRLPCRHDFHEHCLRAWLEQNPSCPTCRHDLGIPPVLLYNHQRTQRTENVALGMLVRNLFNNIGNEGVANQNRNGINNVQPIVTPNTAIQPNQVSGITRMFATAIGLNLGLSIGAAPVVAAAAQAAAMNALPRESGTLNSPSGGASTQVEEVSNVPSQSVDSSTAQEETHFNNQEIQPTATGNDAGDQVRRRSFHFDGSRYFSWLPSLHVELSEVFREVFHVGGFQSFGNIQPSNIANEMNNQQTMGINDTNVRASQANDINDLNALPVSLRIAVEQLTNMFPQFPRSVIIGELLATGVPDLAAENLIARPPPIISASSSINLFSTPIITSAAPSTATTTEYQNNNSLGSVSGSNRDDVTNQPISSSALSSNELLETTDEEEEGSRNLSFAARRKLMLSKARRRFLAKYDNN